MESIVPELLKNGITGVIILILLYVVIHLDKRVKDRDSNIQELNNKMLEVSEKNKDENIGLLERCLLVFQANEKFLTENKNELSDKVINHIKETNQPLIQSINDAIRACKISK